MAGSAEPTPSEASPARSSESTAAGGTRSDARVTLVCTPRDHHSHAVESLDALLAHTDPPFELVYVIGRAPDDVRGEVRRRVGDVGGTFIEWRDYLVPNHARNLALDHVNTEYVVFIDNDALVGAGWLPPLVDCADATGAAIVGPLQLIGPLEQQAVHLAGGFIDLDDSLRPRRFRSTHRHQGRRVDEIAADLRRERCDFAEFHCMLARAETLERIRPLDEHFLSVREVEDLCFTVEADGGTIWFEPGSVVTFLPPEEVRGPDLGYLIRRWSERANQASFEHFCVKWDLDRQLIAERRAFSNNLRRVAFERWRRPIRRPLERLGIAKLESGIALVIFRIERVLNRLLIRPGPTSF
jgi:hypothetical protein